ncbi:proline hydroxylase [Sandarakinorhabdus cyanobacteriorum]|uniref:Proline hydroxylase n=1 Tax=Sandarakinorhabdus cyanobacteriorum TaxID=1981098 RepID=A0A255Z8W6_9SPHN|nr:2OG-Fe(II) oxygenase [Sandarakinorhabdus cyanobacteriorum]OYQ37872.1 proline hydroxylase [Sandarakinorhabdus cyanobacteriorum]
MSAIPPPPADAILSALDRDGHAVLPALLDADACATVAAMFDDGATAFRSTVIMARHGYGQGEYRYFARPLPDMVQQLRETLYPPLAAVANVWADRLAGLRHWPADHTALAAECAAAGQTRPTPLLLRYGPGDHNRLHQDVYGDLVFPLQLAVLLDAPGRDFEGGEFVLVEGRARMQSRARVVPLRRGDAVVFPVRDRPVASARGWSKAVMRHGVADIRYGQRRTLGIIFHDAR